MKVERVGVAGAGTMGAGIAQVAALGGYEARLHDPDPQALDRGLAGARAALEKGAAKGRWSEGEASAAAALLCPAPEAEDLADCELVIEAAPEDLELKRGLLDRLAALCGEQAIFATNTSSIPVAAIAAGVERPERVCGMHFFNPPALMRLVEVVATERSDAETLDTVEEVARAMGREPIRCADSPGFIVNRCNRPFTLESLSILAEGIASHEQIDAVLREDGGFRMGPFELMDLIGIDVNLEVARSFHRQRSIPRWRPHPIQEEMVADGRLGRKSGRGFYPYDGSEARTDPEPLAAELRRSVLDRVVCQLANEAAFAAGEGVAEPAAIDSAMRLGLNHPRGPFEWIDELGAGYVLATLKALHAEHGPDRYELAPLLRDLAP